MKKRAIPNNECIAALIAKCYRLTDGEGLYLIHGKVPERYLWRLDYTFDKKRKTLSLGVYPDVSLDDARCLAGEFRDMLVQGQDPSEWRASIGRRTATLASAEVMLAAQSHGVNSFAVAAMAWYETRRPEWSEGYAKKMLGRIKNHLIPMLGKRPLVSITPQEINQVCKSIQATGTLETGIRVFKICKRIFDFAVAATLTKKNPCMSFTEVLTRPVRKNFPAITEPRLVAKLLKDIDSYRGTWLVRQALLLKAMLMVRGGELRELTWDEVDLVRGTLRIAAERMKGRKHRKKNGPHHVVPLPPQAVLILASIYERRSDSASNYVFPAKGRPGRCMSANTLNAALRRMGYSTKNEMTAHGFRAIARTLIVEELKINKDLAELQLAHTVKTQNGTAYDRARCLPERREMLQSWATYLDRLRSMSLEHIPLADEFTPITEMTSSQTARLIKQIRESSAGEVKGAAPSSHDFENPMISKSLDVTVSR